MTEYICPKCNKTRWRTKIKGKKWQCRNCGYMTGEKKEVPRVVPKAVLKPEPKKGFINWLKNLLKRGRAMVARWSHKP